MSSALKQKGYGYETLTELLMNNGCAVTAPGIKALEEYMTEFKRQVRTQLDLDKSLILKDLQSIIDKNRKSS